MRHAALALVLLAFLVASQPSLHSEVVPGTAEDFLARGIAAFDNDDIGTAIEEFTKAIDLKPDLEDAYFRRGMAYLRLQSYDSAISDFSWLISKSVNDPRYLFWRATAYFHQDNMTSALVDINRALDNDKDYGLGWGLKGDILFRKGDHQGAVAAYDRALAIMGFDLDYSFNRVKALVMSGSYELAVKGCDEIIAKSPDFSDAYYLRADARKASGDFAGAEQDFNTGIAKDTWKDNPEIMFRRALCLQLACKFDAAAGDLRTAIAYPGVERPRYVIHFILNLFLLDRKAEIIEQVRNAKTLFPEVVGTDEFEKVWKPLLSYYTSEIEESTLVEQVIANIENKRFCGLAWYSMAIRNLAFGKKDRATDCFHKVTEMGVREHPEYLQARLFYNLVNEDIIACPPVPVVVGKQPVEPEAAPEPQKP